LIDHRVTAMMILTFSRTKGNIITRVDNHIRQAARHERSLISAYLISIPFPLPACGFPPAMDPFRSYDDG
jgi:hypothetical protein